MNKLVVAGVRQYSPYWKYNESCNEESHTKHNEKEVTQALVLGIVGQLSSLLKNKTENILYIVLHV